ncbi:hypothetical protein SSPSH_000062 [Salinisphaera shabanensis E1L3A]|uniref:Uncharacterized protein n=1 Tax=Salinisphaera shabanensis E1L3A TaxID=1033802 RepID=U2ESP6_9GAMM|nr:hypothetical protein [Salinisphaera shabanensis]ERJ20720.1 hypothetical protein SSPSH_000062 [Salinisphaera shabanensis E1L3A]
MNAPAWKLELLALAYRYTETGVQYDLAAMNDAEQYAALSWLRRYAEGRA